MRKFSLFVIIILISFNIKGIKGQNQKNESNSDTIIQTGIDDTELFVYFYGSNDGPSSEKKLLEFINNNLIYPDTAIKAKIEGKVLVSFAINQLGKISDIRILKGLSPEIDNEVIRVINKMPDWIWDKKIDLKYRKTTRRAIPIYFKLKK